MNHSPITSLAGQTAVVTGFRGAIGHAVAMRLASKGCRIIGLVRNNNNEVQTKIDALPNQQLNHYSLAVDITVSEQVQKIADQITSCDILINSAGATVSVPHSHTELLTDHLFDQMLTDNLRSVYTVTRTFLPLLKQSQDGLIVNIGSSVANGVGGSNIAYACAKAGVNSLTRNLSKVIAPVRIITISPGGVDTDFIKNRKDNHYEGAIARTPLARIATPDDVAGAVEAYATLVRFVTGECVTIDGGWSV